MGGAILQKFAIQRPDILSSLILISSFSSVDHHLREVLMELLRVLRTEGYNGSIADMARDLRKELRKNEIAKTMPLEEFFDNYQECYECLGAMVNLRCKGCKYGFRSKFCKIAKCTQKKGYQGCCECDEFQTCQNFFKSIHKDVNTKNLRKIKRQELEGFLKRKIHQ